jgi:hypothetical protein
MKKSTLILVIIMMATLGVQSQTVLYSDNFDSYTMGGYLAIQDPTWFGTWENKPGTGQDALISKAFANSPKLSVLVDETGGATDLLLKLGDKTTGSYELKWMMYVESGKAAYYNIQHFQTPGTVNEFAMQAWFRASGTGELEEGGTFVTFTYPKDTWFEIKQIIDLDANYIQYYVNGIIVKIWPFNYQVNSTSGAKQLGGVDFFAGAKPGSGEKPKYFFDDISYKTLPPTSVQSPDWLWAKPLNGTTSEGGAYSASITLDQSGNIYTTGSFSGTVDFDPGAGTSDLTSSVEGSGFVLKTDASGNFVWARQIGAAGVSIAVDGLGNVYTAGNLIGTADFDPGTGVFNLTSCEQGDAFISKLDKDGNFGWAKSMFGLNSDAVSMVSSIALDASGNVYTTGGFLATTDFNPGTDTFNFTASGVGNMFISKLDSLGDFVWAKTIGGVSQVAGSWSNSIAIDASGNVYTTGSFSDTVDFDPGTGIVNLSPLKGGINSAFISKLDASGNFVWVKQMGGTDSPFLSGNSIVLDVSGNIYTTGIFQDTIDFDPGSAIFNLAATASSTDIFVSKYTNSGDFIWAKSMGGAGHNSGNSIALDSFGNVFTTGMFQGAGDFDPGEGIFNISQVAGSGFVGAYISKLDHLGKYIWANSIEGSTGGTQFSGVSCSSIVTDAANNVFVTGGSSTPSVSFGAIQLTKTGSSTGFIARLGDKTTGIEKVVKRDETFSVFPNPTNGKITINSNSTIGSVEIYNLLGARIPAEIILNKQKSCEVDLSGKPKGIYLVNIKCGETNGSKKIVLQ